MKGLFGDGALGTIKKAKKVFLWSAVCALIGAFLLGAILILSDGANSVGMGKIMGTLFIVSIVLFVGVNNFVRMENANKAIQGFGLASLICNLIWLVIAILLIWEIIPASTYDTARRYGFTYTTAVHLSAMTKIMAMAMSLGAASFWISNVMSIKETVRPVKPLKITAIACEIYCSLFAIVVVLSDVYNYEMDKWYLLSALAGLAFVTSACAALIISKTSGKNEQNATLANAGTASTTTKFVGKSEEELRAEIEEQVKREMIEKEVRARMEAEMGKKGDKQ
ncbi:hypothetical protein IJJ36_01325 [Candidatus Saccharibacteria bacterium]|nr:hypothetical protein [Candidatus Saccharibacteria bacterium]